MRNQADIDAFLAFSTDKSKQPAYQAEYQNNPAVIAQKKQNAGVKGVADGAKAVYDKGGDQALADYYLNADRKYATREQVNPAKLVKAGKTTFADVAKQEQQEMKAAAGSMAKAGLTSKNLMYPNGQFNFALGGSGSSSSQPKSGGVVTTQPANTQPDDGSSSQPKFSWQKGKERAQNFQKKLEYANKDTASYLDFDPKSPDSFFKNSEGSGKMFNKQYDFSSSIPNSFVNNKNA